MGCCQDSLFVQETNNADFSTDEIKGSSLMKQPIIDLVTGELFGFEILTRIPDLSKWETLQKNKIFLHYLDVHALKNAGTIFENVKGQVFVNISHISIGQGLMQSWCCNQSADSDRLVFEVHEETPDNSWVLPSMISLALDDFGICELSYKWLQRTCVDFVKIDKSFIRDKNFAKIQLGRILKTLPPDTKIIVEGIEYERQLKLAVSLGAHYGQGFLLGHPAPLYSNFSDSRYRDVLPCLKI